MSFVRLSCIIACAVAVGACVSPREDGADCVDEVAVDVRETGASESSNGRLGDGEARGVAKWRILSNAFIFTVKGSKALYGRHIQNCNISFGIQAVIVFINSVPNAVFFKDQTFFDLNCEMLLYKMTN